MKRSIHDIEKSTSIYTILLYYSLFFLIKLLYNYMEKLKSILLKLSKLCGLTAYNDKFY